MAISAGGAIRRFVRLVFVTSLTGDFCILVGLTRRADKLGGKRGSGNKQKNKHTET